MYGPWSTVTYLKLSLTAQQSNCEIIHSARLMRVIGLIPRLHDIVITQPSQRRVGELVNRRRMQRYCLVVRDVPPSLAFAAEEFGVEAPGNYRVYDYVVCAVDVVLLGEYEELALAAPVAGSVDSMRLAYV